jgi:hypothetical protein
MKRILTVLFSLALIVLLGQFSAYVLAVSPLITTAAFVVLDVVAYFVTPFGVALNAISITQLTAALGAYYRANKQILTSEMLLGSNIQSRYEVNDGVKDELPLPTLEVGDLVKPANDVTFQPTTNALTFGARILKVRAWKVDLLIVPNALEKTWLGQYYQKGSSNYKIPFEQFVMNYIIAKINENIRLQSTYKGVYNAAGTTPLDVFNGWLKLIADEVTAGNIVPIVTGAITSVNVVDKLLAVHDGLGEAYKASPTEMPVNSTIFDWYTRKFTPVLNANLVAMDPTGARPLLNEVMLTGTNCLLVREAGLGTSQRVHVTPKENRVYGCDSIGEENNIRVQEFERTIKLMVDAKSGVNFKQVHARALSCNDQA